MKTSANHKNSTFWLKIGLGIFLLWLWLESPSWSLSLLSNLGSYHRPISTQNLLAQAYFDQGITLFYGYNYELARQSFEQALDQDPNCALCYWGIAVAWGSSLNTPMSELGLSKGQQALTSAQAILEHKQEQSLEKALIQATLKRYQQNSVKTQSERDQAYATAMENLYQDFPQDPDVATLYAEALMNLSTSDYWTETGDPQPNTLKILSTLESALSQDPNHPGANHLYIHLLEDSPMPERALASAQRLEILVPSSGHLVHAASHIYCALGLYADAYRVNLLAIAADETTPNGIPDPDHPSYYSLAYYLHNWQNQIGAAVALEQPDIALYYAQQLLQRIPAVAYQLVPELEELRTFPSQIMVQFSLWNAIFQQPRPIPTFHLETAFWHWARAFAWINQGHIAPAQLNLSYLKALAQHQLSYRLYSGVPAQILMDLALDSLISQLNQQPNLEPMHSSSRFRSAHCYPSKSPFFGSSEIPPGNLHRFSARTSQANQSARGSPPARQSSDLASGSESFWDLTFYRFRR